ncbi:MAG: YidH family protein [Pseudobdellovibrionaceae bacterium]
MNSSKQPDIRSHLANERTHLANLRTGISVISFGVTLNRFSLYLLQNNMISRQGGRPVLRDTENVGIGMVILGSILLIWSVFHFLKTARQINTATYMPSKWSILSFTVAVIIIGSLSAVWMFLG